MAILAQQNPTYQPAMRIIASITQSNPAIVTTTFAHNYSTGLIVRILIAPGFGMPQINKLYAPIEVTGPTTFIFPVNSSDFEAFVIPSMVTPDKFYTSSQVLPIGEVNSRLDLATRNVL